MKLFTFAVLLGALTANAQPHCGHGTKFQTENVAGKWKSPNGHVLTLELQSDGTLTLDKTMRFTFKDGWYRWGENPGGAPVDALSLQVACADANRMYVHHQYQAFEHHDTLYHDYVDEWTRLK